MSERSADDDLLRLLPVELPSGVSEREAAEFAEGLATLDRLVARLRTYAEDSDAPAHDAP